VRHLISLWFLYMSDFLYSSISKGRFVPSNLSSSSNRNACRIASVEKAKHERNWFEITNEMIIITKSAGSGDVMSSDLISVNKMYEMKQVPVLMKRAPKNM